MHRSSYSAITIGPAFSPQAGHDGSRRTLNVRKLWSIESYVRSRPTSGSPNSSNNLIDRKSTRLNSSHLGISYAVFCLKKKKKINIITACTNDVVLQGGDSV